MKVGSTFSGIGGMDLGLEQAGMEVVWQVEIDPFRRRTLKRHWPDVERYEDVRTINANTLGYGKDESISGRCSALSRKRSKGRTSSTSNIDLLCGGFPCQDLSVAGRRAGLQAERSGLFFEFARLAGELRTDWLLIENVPGLLSSNKGEDFETVLQTLSELGYALAWRVLDSRYFGVPQRRRRVYIIGHIRADCAAAVLFEPEGGTGDTQAGGKEGKGTAPAVARSITRTSYKHYDEDTDTLITFQEDSKVTTGKGNAALGVGGSGHPYVCAPADSDGVREATGVPRRLDPQSQAPVTDVIAATIVARLRASPPHGALDGINLVATTIVNPGKQWNSQQNEPNLATGVVEGAQRLSRALKPCCPDGPRYAALGDAVTTNVVEWIGRRMMIVNEEIK